MERKNTASTMGNPRHTCCKSVENASRERTNELGDVLGDAAVSFCPRQQVHALRGCPGLLREAKLLEDLIAVLGL